MYCVYIYIYNLNIPNPPTPRPPSCPSVIAHDLTQDGAGGSNQGTHNGQPSFGRNAARSVVLGRNGRHQGRVIDVMVYVIEL